MDGGLRAGLVGAVALLAAACGAEVEAAPGDDGPEPPSFPCRAAVTAEVALADADVGSLLDIVATAEGSAVLTLVPRERLVITRLSPSLSVQWTVELPTPAERNTRRIGPALILGTSDGGLFVASVDPAATDEPRRVALRRFAADGSPIWTRGLDDTPDHRTLALDHTGEVLTLLVDSEATGEVDLVRLTLDGDFIHRVSATASRPDAHGVSLAVAGDGTAFVAGQQSSSSGERPFTLFGTAFSASGSVRWSWTKEDDGSRFGGHLRIASLSDDHWLATHVGEVVQDHSTFRTILIDPEGHVLDDRRNVIEPEGAVGHGGQGIVAMTPSADGGAVLAVHTGEDIPGEDWLVRLDARAREVWRRRLDVGGVRPSAVREGPGGGLVLVGDAPTARGQEGVVRVWSTDAEGRGRWRWDIARPERVPAPAVVAEADGAVLVAGSFDVPQAGRSTVVRRLVERCDD